MDFLFDFLYIMGSNSTLSGRSQTRPYYRAHYKRKFEHPCTKSGGQMVPGTHTQYFSFVVPQARNKKIPRRYHQFRVYRGATWDLELLAQKAGFGVF